MRNVEKNVLEKKGPSYQDLERRYPMSMDTSARTRNITHATHTPINKIHPRHHLRYLSKEKKNDQLIALRFTKKARITLLASPAIKFTIFPTSAPAFGSSACSFAFFASFFRSFRSFSSFFLSALLFPVTNRSAYHLPEHRTKTHYCRHRLPRLSRQR